MLNNRTSRELKDAAYGALAEVGKALVSARRLELVDALAQGERSVDALAAVVEQPIANTSQHLQVLRRSGLVEVRRDGRTIHYRLADGVSELLVALRRLGHARSAAAGQAAASVAGDGPDPIERPAVLRHLADGTALLIDVRPVAEHAAGHLPGAVCVPPDRVEELAPSLPRDRLLVAYCRGPYCRFAGDAVRLLRVKGLQAVRFEDGVAEWTAAGGELAVGAGA